MSNLFSSSDNDFPGIIARINSVFIVNYSLLRTIFLQFKQGIIFNFL